MYKFVKSLAFLSAVVAVITAGTFGQVATRAEYTVYSVVLKKIFKEDRVNFSKHPDFVFLESTGTKSEPGFPPEKKYGDLILDYQRKNYSSVQIEKRFPLRRV